ALECARIDFERHFGGLARERFAHGGDQLPNTVRGEQRRRTAAQVDRRELEIAESRAAHRELRAQRGHVAVLGLASERARRHDGEVAVRTDPHTERDVQVDAEIAHRERTYGGARLPALGYAG